MPSADRQQETTGGLGPGERARLLRHGLANNSAALLASAIGFALVPLMLTGLGAETYGLWITAAAVASAFGALDLGLGFTLMREIAAASERAAPVTKAFVASAGRVVLLVGLSGGLLIAFGGGLLAGHLDLSPPVRRLAPGLFALYGLAFLADRLFAFHAAVLQGARRFTSLNLLLASWALLRGSGLALLVLFHPDVRALAACHALAAWVLLAGALVTVRIQAPAYRLRLDIFVWEPLRKQLRLSLSWQLSTWLGGLFWQIAPVLIGVMVGAAAVVPFYVGHKIPQVLSAMGWRSAEVLLPPSSLEHRRGDRAALREILRLGTRWIAMLIVPLCGVVWILAPRVLAAWLGEVDPQALRVLRLILPAAAMDSLAAAAVALLWGRGAARRILEILGLAIAVHLALGLWLIPRLGPVGAAWGLLAAIAVGAAGFLVSASLAVGRSALEILRLSLAGLALPAMAATLTSAALAYLSLPLGAWGLPLTSAVGLAGFWALCLARPGRRAT